MEQQHAVQRALNVYFDTVRPHYMSQLNALEAIVDGMSRACAVRYDESFGPHAALPGGTLRLKRLHHHDHTLWREFKLPLPPPLGFNRIAEHVRCTIRAATA